MFQQYFSFREFGSEKAAFTEAKRCWKEISQAFPQMSRRDFAEIQRRKSSSGIVGVRRIVTHVRGHTYAFWSASFTDQRGYRRVRSFSVNRYGEAGAKRRALKARRRGVRELQA